MHKLLALLAVMVGGLLWTGVAGAATGDLVGVVHFSQDCGSGIGVGIAYDGAGHLWVSCDGSNPDLLRADASTGVVDQTYNITGGLGALAYDATRNGLWAGWGGGKPAGTVMFIQLDATKSVTGSSVAFVAPQDVVFGLDDGMGYDASDDTLYISDDGSTIIHQHTTTGVPIRDIPWAGTGCYNSGVAIGGSLLFEGSDGCSHVWVVNKVTNAPAFDFSTAVAGDPNFRDEGLTCDTKTFAPTQVMWSKEAYSPNRAAAFEIPPGTCGVGGQPAAKADLGIAKTGPSSAFVGDNFTYTLTVTNNGPDASPGGTVTDTLPANVSYVSDDDSCTNAANVVTCPVGALAVAASRDIHITVKATASGPAANTACVKGDAEDDNAANDCATFTSQLKPKNADLSIVKSGPAFAQSGGTISYNIAVHNGGPADATNVTVSDTLPAGETLVSATPSQGSCGPPPVTCNLGTVLNAGSATVTIVVKVTAGCGSTLKNTATVSGDQPDNDPSNNSSSTSAFVFCVVAGGNFVIGDKNAAVGTAVTFWGAQWWKLNSLSGGAAPAAFKGFEDKPATVTCGVNWSTDPGNSPPPPPGPLPSYMAVLVSSSISQSGPTISGNTVHVVIVQTNSGYAPDPGHAGTGTVYAQIC